MGNEQALKKLYTKSHKVMIPKKITKKLKELGIEQVELELFAMDMEEAQNTTTEEGASLQEQSEKIFETIAKSLRVSVAEAKKMSVVYIGDLMDEIARINNFDPKKKETRLIKEFIAKRGDGLKLVEST